MPQRTSTTLVVLQFLTLAVIALSGPLLYPEQRIATLQLLGALFAVWAVVHMWGRSRVHVEPTVHQGDRLVTTGPYRCIRNPMYLGLLVAVLPAVAAAPTPLRLVAAAVLLFALVTKIRREEVQLAAAFPEYTTYKQHTWRMIPWVW